MPIDTPAGGEHVRARGGAADAGSAPVDQLDVGGGERPDRVVEGDGDRRLAGRHDRQRLGSPQAVPLAPPLAPARFTRTLSM